MKLPVDDPTVMRVNRFVASHGLVPGATRDDARSLPASVPRAARLLIALLARIEHGRLQLRLPGGEQLEFGRGEPCANLVVRDWRVFEATLKSGDIGFAEAYIDGLCESDSVSTLLDVAVANRRVLDDAIFGRWWGRALHRLRHLLNRNSRSGSRRNVHAHYDLGNSFYQLWLDPSMTYSSALFDGAGERPIEDAQRAKYARIADELGLPEGASVLEIGCGWGGFAEHAASRGLRVHGLTLSTEQLGYSRDRIARASLESRASFSLRDYRDERGTYDGIASIEMFEAVGESYWPSYFRTLRERLAPGGRAVVQTITIADSLFERYRRSTDFIQQYVFPGGMLPSPGVFEAQARRAGLRIARRFAFGQDYARTLQVWRERFDAQLAQVRSIGFDERFTRLWNFYLAYCEAGFRHRNTDVYQFTLERSSAS